ncbi:MAG: hypothetical protein GXP14_15495 [Gammaproteobacteria bacterium]|nr:hypothetical protein [Gammaproteobacteria bacterium]
MNHPFMTAGLIITTVFFSTAMADVAISNKLTFYGDSRIGFYSLDRDDRDGKQSRTSELRLRLRPGIKANINDKLSASIRLAGRYSTDDRNNNNFEWFSSIPKGDGLRRGDSTVDELYFNYQPVSNVELRMGRMQTKFELDGVAKKSLDRNNSPNSDITWTDGFYLKYALSRDWKAHFIVQYNDKSGSTEVRRSPLNFDDDESRISYFAALESKAPKGAFIQRGIDLTYIPSALRTNDTETGNIEDYIALVGRTAARWPIGSSGMKFMLGGELGYAFNTQTEAVAKIGSSNKTGGLATQVTLNFIDFFPSHSFGIVLARAEAGWLLSPDFRSNNTLIEGRYKWQWAKKHKIEGRLRQREDIDQLTTKMEKRTDLDLYFRYTYQF